MDLFMNYHLKLQTDITFHYNYITIQAVNFAFSCRDFFPHFGSKNYNLIHHPPFSTAAPCEWNHLQTELKLTHM